MAHTSVTSPRGAAGSRPPARGPVGGRTGPGRGIAAVLRTVTQGWVRAWAAWVHGWAYPVGGVGARVWARWHAVPGRAREAGMTTAEYAIGTVAACTFAALLIAVVRSPEIKAALLRIITGALGLGG